MIKFESAYLRRKDKFIFKDLNLYIQKKEKVLIQGKSGMGKTTLFKLLLGFETLDKGKVIFNGKPISKEHIHEIRNSIFYLSQDIDLKNIEVRLLLDEIQDVQRLKPGPDKINMLLDILDLNPHILDQNVKDLSGGERQRIHLARALAQEGK